MLLASLLAGPLLLELCLRGLLFHDGHLATRWGGSLRQAERYGGTEYGAHLRSLVNG